MNLVKVVGGRLVLNNWLVWGAALVAMSSSLADAQAPTGKMRIRMSDFSVTLVYRLEQKMGAYLHAAEQLSSVHVVECDCAPNATDESDSRLVSQDLGPNETVQLAFIRQGQSAQLQWYMLAMDPRTLEVVPVTERRTLRLTKGTWADFEAGRDVQAELDSPFEETEVRRLFNDLAEDYFYLVYRDILLDRGLQISEPRIEIKNVSKRQITLSKSSIQIVYSGVETVVEVDFMVRPERQKSPGAPRATTTALQAKAR